MVDVVAEKLIITAELKNLVRGEAERAAKQIEGMTRRTETSLKKQESAWLGLTGRIKSFAKAQAGLIAAGTAAAFGASAIRNAREFAKAIGEVSTLVDTAAVDVDMLAEGVRELAVAQDQNQVDVARGLYQAISAGAGEGADAIVFLTQATKLATAGVADADSTVRLLASTLNAYGKELGEAEAVSDLFFTTVRSGITTLPELAGSFSRVTPLAAALGVELQDVLAIFATLTAAGTPTAEAATQIAGALRGFLNVSDDAREELAAFNIELTQSAIETEGLIPIIDKLRDAYGGNAQALREIFPESEALLAILTLTGENADRLAESYDALANSAGSTEIANRKILDTLGGPGARGFAAAKASFTAVGKAALRAFDQIVMSLQEAETLLKTLDISVKLVAVGFQTIGFVIGGVVASIDLLLSSIGRIIASPIEAFTGGLAEEFDQFARSVSGAEEAVTSLGGSFEKFTGVDFDDVISIPEFSQIDRFGNQIVAGIDMAQRDLLNRGAEFRSAASEVLNGLFVEIEGDDGRVEAALRKYIDETIIPGLEAAGQQADASTVGRFIARQLQEGINDAGAVTLALDDGTFAAITGQFIEQLADVDLQARQVKNSAGQLGAEFARVFDRDAGVGLTLIAAGLVASAEAADQSAKSTEDDSATRLANAEAIRQQEAALSAAEAARRAEIIQSIRDLQALDAIESQLLQTRAANADLASELDTGNRTNENALETELVLIQRALDLDLARLASRSKIGDITPVQLQREIEARQLLAEAQTENIALEQERIERAIAAFEASQTNIDRLIENAGESGQEIGFLEAFVARIGDTAEQSFNTMTLGIQAADFAANQLGDGIAGAIGSITDGTKSAGEAFKDLGVTILQELQRIIIRLLIVKAIEDTINLLAGASSGDQRPSSSTPGDASGGKRPRGFQAGGRPGTTSFDGGGVFSSETFRVAERNRPEAVVPLLNGTSIPVRNVDGGNSRTGTTLNQTVIFKDSDTVARMTDQEFDQMLVRRQGTLTSLVFNAARSGQSRSARESIREASRSRR